MAESTTITPKALAAEIGCTPKALRRFMRSHADAATKAGVEPVVPRCGQGHRYDIAAKDAKRIKDAWAKAHAPKAEDATA